MIHSTQHTAHITQHTAHSTQHTVNAIVPPLRCYSSSSSRLTLRLERLDDSDAGSKTRHAGKLAAVTGDEAGFVDDADHGKIVPLPALVVVFVMGGGDLHGTRAKRHVNLKHKDVVEIPAK